MKHLCIYHGGCDDGFGSALCLFLQFGIQNEEFYPGVFGKNIPNAEMVKDRVVYLVDFSYRKDIIIEMAKSAAQIIILDHHVTAEADLNELEGHKCKGGLPIVTVFDKSKSGVGVTWDYFRPGMPTPDLLRHIQDWDLQKLELEDTEIIIEGLRSYPQEFDVWLSLIRSADCIKTLKREGTAIDRFLGS